MAPRHKPRNPTARQTHNIRNHHDPHQHGQRNDQETRGNTHRDTYMTPSDTIHKLDDVIEIQDHKHLNNQTTYLAMQWSPEILTQEQINACTNEGFKPKHIHPITYQTSTPTYKVRWQLTWHLESTITECESGPHALAQYKQRTQTPIRTKRRTPQVNTRTTKG